MNWTILENDQQVEQIATTAAKKKVLVFKHSLTCPVSASALSDLEADWDDAEMGQVDTYLLPIQDYRQLSNKIEKLFGVRHESPQVLVIADGACQYHNSHWKISYGALRPQLLGLA